MRESTRTNTWATWLSEFPTSGPTTRRNTIAAVNANYEATVNAVSGGRRRENSPHDRRRRSPSLPPAPGPYKEDGDLCYYHHTYGDR